MEEKDISLNMKLTADKSQLLIFDGNSDSLVARLSFYQELPQAKIDSDNKLKIGHHLMTKIYMALHEQSKFQAANLKEMRWEDKVSAFKQAYDVEQNKNEATVTWLLNSILDITPEEARRRYDAASELLSHPEFKDKEDIIVEKIYSRPEQKKID